MDLGVGDKEAERLLRDIKVPVNKPLEAKDARDKEPRREPPTRRGGLPSPTTRSEEARIMATARGTALAIKRSQLEPKWQLKKTKKLGSDIDWLYIYIYIYTLIYMHQLSESRKSNEIAG